MTDVHQATAVRVGVFLAGMHLLESPQAEATLLQRLSPAERHQLAQVRSAKRHREFLLSRALMRAAFEVWAGASADTWSLDADPEGRPRIRMARAPAPDISVSHSGDHVLCVLGENAKVGVDVEQVRVRDIDSLAAEVLAENELAALNRKTGAGRAHMFYQFWTLKEAYAKALGVGLGTSFRRLVFGLDGAHITFDVAHAGEITEFLSFVPATGAVAALALLLPTGHGPAAVELYAMDAPDRLHPCDIDVVAASLTGRMRP